MDSGTGLVLSILFILAPSTEQFYKMIWVWCGVV